MMGRCSQWCTLEVPGVVDGSYRAIRRPTGLERNALRHRSRIASDGTLTRGQMWPQLPNGMAVGPKTQKKQQVVVQLKRLKMGMVSTM